MKKIFGFLGALILSFGVNFNTRAEDITVRCVFWGSDISLSGEDRSQKTEIIKKICENISGSCCDCDGSISFVEKNYAYKTIKFQLVDTPTQQKYGIPAPAMKNCNIVVYVCTDANDPALIPRLNSINEKTSDNCKVILVASAENYDTVRGIASFVAANMSTARQNLGKKLVERDYPFSVIPQLGVNVMELFSIMCETAMEQQNSKNTADTLQPNTSESRKTCLLL